MREDLKDFFEEDYGFEPMLSEFNSFPTDPCVGTFENCLSNLTCKIDGSNSAEITDELSRLARKLL